MYYTNPMTDFYMRQSMPQINFPPQNQPQIKTYLVTSVEEAKAAMIDPLATNIFIDTSSGKMYLKNMGNDGRPQFLVYAIEEQSVPKDPMNEINERLTNIENFLGGLKNESVSSYERIVEPITVPQPATAGKDEPNGTTKSAGIPKNAGNDKREK